MAYLDICGNGAKDIDTIIDELETDLEAARKNVLGITDSGSGSVPEIPDVFKNETAMSDGNVYGILLHVKGVAVNGFTALRETVNDDKGNNDIYLKNINIKGIKSTPEETVVIQQYSSGDGVNTGYNNGSIIKGPVGDVFDICYNTNVDGIYKPNSLANAQLILGKYKLNSSISAGTTLFTEDIIEWVGEGSKISSIVKTPSEDYDEGDLFYKYGLDAMAHVMKGNFGLFVSGGIDIRANNVDVAGSVAMSGSNPDNNPVPPNMNSAYDLLVVSSIDSDELLQNVTYDTVHSSP